MSSPFWAGLRSTVISGYRWRGARKKGICSQNGHGRIWGVVGQGPKRSPRISCCLGFFFLNGGGGGPIQSWVTKGILIGGLGTSISGEARRDIQISDKEFRRDRVRESAGSRTHKKMHRVASTFFILRSPILIYDLFSFFGSLYAFLKTPRLTHQTWRKKQIPKYCRNVGGSTHISKKVNNLANTGFALCAGFIRWVFLALRDVEREGIRPGAETRQDLFLSLSDAKNSIFLWHRVTPHLEWPATTTVLFAKKTRKIHEKPKSQNQFCGPLRKPTTALTMTAAAGRPGVGGGKTRLHGSSKFTLWGKRVYVAAPVFRIYFMFPCCTVR